MREVVGMGRRIWSHRADRGSRLCGQGWAEHLLGGKERYFMPGSYVI